MKQKHEISKDTLYKLLNFSQQVMLVCDASLVLIWGNTMASRLLHRSVGEFINQPLDKVFKQCDYSCPVNIKKHKKAVCAKDIFTYVIDGEEENICWHLHSILSSEPLYAVIGSLVTEVENIKNDLFQLNEIIHQAPGFVFWKDSNSVLQGCNRNFADQIGLNNPSEVKGKTDYDLPWSSKETEAFIKDDYWIMQSGLPKLNIEEKQHQLNGEEKFLLTSKVPLRNRKNKICGVLGIYWDITERKQIENQLRLAKERAEMANQAKVKFLEDMRHSIRIPLTGMVSFSEMIKEEIEDPKLKSYADNLVIASTTLLEFLNEILDAIKIASEELPILKCKFNFRKQVDTILKLVRPKALNKKLQIKLHYDNRLPNYLVGDAKRISRILLELITNALRFTHQGCVSISVNLISKRDRNMVIECSIEDTGIGIPLEEYRSIFLRFNRLTPSYQGIYKGVGLGLSIVKQFIDDIEGEIYCESKLDQGSIFTCLFPLTEAMVQDDFGVQEMDKLLVKDLSCEPASIGNKEQCQRKDAINILVVEDQLVAAKAICSILESMNCYIHVASTAKQAIDYINQSSYDLIFLDIGLPDMSGFELAKKIKKLRQYCDNPIPILGLTAHFNLTTDSEVSEDHGLDTILSKPLKRKTAENIISNLGDNTQTNKKP